MCQFVGRKQELFDLKQFLEKRIASFLVVKGRRRIGKSRLIEEFAKLNKLKLYSFLGLAPENGITAQTQRDEFARQLGLKNANIQDWTDLFEILANTVKSTTKEKVVIFLDEITWMAMDDSTFLGKLKNAWDLKFKKNNKLILIVCGSVSSWIDKNILTSAGFVGRISYVLTLEGLPLYDCNKFWDNAGGVIAPYDKLKALSITGGVPRYLEELNVFQSAEANIQKLCFKKGGLLYEEFNRIFNSTFVKRSKIYKNILTHILVGRYDPEKIYDALKIKKTGTIIEYLTDLESAGFVKRDYTWNIKTGKKSKLSKYRISDNYIRFYLKYIEPNQDLIERGAFENRTLTSLPGWETILGLQFENLVLNNRKEVQNLLEVKPDDVIYDNPFFQTKTKRQEGCQIDYLIQTRFNTLYVCEIKFSKNLIGAGVINEVKEKIKKLKLPAGISCRPVLIHANSVTDDLLDERYFANIIDFSELLKKQ